VTRHTIVPVPAPPRLSCAEIALQKIWGEMPIKERFGDDCSGILLLQQCWQLYQVPKSASGSVSQLPKQSVPWFVFPEGVRTRNIVRHPLNNRWQLSMHLKCKRSCNMRGVIGCIRGEAWFVENVGRKPPLLAIGWGTLSDAFYACVEDDVHKINKMIQARSHPSFGWLYDGIPNWL